MKNVEFSPTAKHQLDEWEQTDKRIYDKIDQLIEDIQNRPFSGMGKPEPLKYQFRGYWSRRITQVHRLVYKVTSDSIIVVSCRYHY